MGKRERRKKGSLHRSLVVVRRRRRLLMGNCLVCNQAFTLLHYIM